MPIEGMQLDFGPDGPAVEYQVCIAGEGWTPWLSAGEFAGSRGRSRALTGLRLRLTPDQDAVVDVEALFLGSPIMLRSGPSVELISASGVDPLIGLRVLPPQPSKLAQGRAIQAASSSDSRPTRVFRASNRRASR